MFSKKIRLNSRNKSISVATALVLLAIDEIIEKDNKINWVYGYQIMSHLKEAFNWQHVKSGTVYPILKSLDQKNFIRQGVGPDPQKDNNRQTIYYKITKHGEKLAEELKGLNDDALESALLSSSRSLNDSKSWSFGYHKFPDTDFTGNYFIPMLFEYDRFISRLITPDIDSDRIDELLSEVNKSLTEIDDFKNILKVHLSKLNKIKKLNNGNH